MAESSTPATDCDRPGRLVAPPTGPVDAYRDWTVGETVIGTRLPDDSVRQWLFAAVELMGCQVLRITTAAGTPLPEWDAPTDEEQE